MVFHWCIKNSHLIYTIKTIKLTQYIVKLNRVFFPHYFFQVRSLGCGFKARSLETVRITLLHSCASQIERRSYYPHLSYFPSLHNLNTGQKSQSVKNKKTTPLKQLNSFNIQSSSTGSSFPTTSSKSVLLAAVSKQDLLTQ